MTHRHPLPRIWLMTDPRFGDELPDAVRRLPTGSGVVFRHYELSEPGRHLLFGRLARICRRRGIVILLAGTEKDARHWHANGFHRRSSGKSRLIHSMAVHDRTELALARQLRADLVFISPLFATASHREQRPLGRLAFNRLAKQAGPMKVIALGGVTPARARTLPRSLIHGWAGIDAFRKKRR
ncbi:MAG: thiamine phosphate synthase [Sphingomonadaceae bacterium]|nr:thiamine phosphate synthase [Sphingomonadaceae bacterium]